MGRPGTTVFVGNISYETTEEQLKEVFSQAGIVMSFRLMYDHETGKAKGFGFCEYEDKETAMSARRNLNGTELNGRNLRVDLTENDKQAAAAAQAAQAAQAKRLNAINIPGLPPGLNSGNPTMARMSPLEIHETMIALKKGIENDANLVRETLRAKPLLALAILHGQIMLGMVPPPSNPNVNPMQQQQPMGINPMNPMMNLNAPNNMNMRNPQMMGMQQPPMQMNRPVTPVGVRSIQQQRQVQQQMGRNNPGPPPGLRQPPQNMPGAPPGLRQPPQAGLRQPPQAMSAPPGLRQPPQAGLRQPPPQMNPPGLRQPPPPGLRQPQQQMPGPPQMPPPGLRQPPGVPIGGGGLRQPPPGGLRQPPQIPPPPPNQAPPPPAGEQAPLQLNEEQASLFATVMALTDEQIARLPAGEREGVMIVRNQFANQQQQQQQQPPQY